MKYILSVCLMAFGTQCWAAGAQPVENFTAKLFTAKGTVEYLRKGDTNWVAVKAPFMLEVGDQVRTGARSKAELYIKYGSKIRLSDETTFVIGQVAPGLIPWAWTVNGAFSVLAPLLAVMVAMVTGFQGVLLLGAGAYLLAFFVSRRFRVDSG